MCDCNTASVTKYLRSHVIAPGVSRTYKYHGCAWCGEPIGPVETVDNITNRVPTVFPPSYDVRANRCMSDQNSDAPGVNPYANLYSPLEED